MRRGYKVVQRLSALPDDDFVYVANSRYFLPTGGGYGGQASACVQRLGGTSIKVPGGAGFSHRKVERSIENCAVRLKKKFSTIGHHKF